MKVLSRLLFVVVFAGLVSGCKLAVLAPPGGNVQSLSGTRDCFGPGYCEIDINDADFSETFTAVPRPGFEFVKWQSGEGFLCGNSTDPECTVTLPGGVNGDNIVATAETASIRPLFSGEDIDTDGDGIVNEIDTDDDNDGLLDGNDDCPLDEPNLNGLGCPTLPPEEMAYIYDRNWAQLHWLDGVSWHEINATCPPPDGICFGKIGDVDVSGWTWATGLEVTDLLNEFLVTPLGAFPDDYDVGGWTTFSPNMFNYFWGQDDLGAVSLYGWVRDEANVVEGYIMGLRCAAMADNDCYNLSAGVINSSLPIPKTAPDGAVWLYRLE